MSQDDIDVGQQASFANQLSNSLAEANSRMNVFADASRSQAKFAIDIADSFLKTSEHLDSIANSTEKINDCLGNFLSGVKSLSNTSGMNEFFKNFVKHIDNTTDRYKKTAQAQEELAEAAEKAQTSSEKSQEALNKAAAEEKKYSTSQEEQSRKYIENLTKATRSAEEHNKTQEEFAKAAEEAEEAGRSWAQAFKSTISAGIGLIKMIGSLISTATTWVKTVFTLPFMVLKNVVQAGNALRTDLITVIEQAAQDTKEFFDSTSDIGQGIRKMTSMGKGMLLAFENVNSDAVKLFGQGTAGIANMIKETADSIKAMRHYSEMFGKTITKNKEALFNFTRVKKAMGLEDDQIAYYAQDAALNLMGFNKRVTVMALLTDDVSKQYGVDMKRLSKNFNTLRKDIALYGHLSDEELLKSTARLTQMKISVEDASNVFKKFNTFEDAANSVAMLSQTFGMNLDAMEMIQAKNPEDIINMFRDSMIATGRTFDEFNRFEKEILADQTGMSQEGLKALMTLRDKGLTHQEAVDAMKDQTPEAKQLKAIKELSSSIKLLQKVMNFTSPFEAFMKGLEKNSYTTKAARQAFMSLSNTYQMIHDFAINLDGDTVSALLEPVIIIVNVMKNILNSPGFKGGLANLVRGFSNLAMNLFGVTETDKIYTVLEQNLTGMTKDQKKTFSREIYQIEKDLEKTSVKNLYEEFKAKKGKQFSSSAERFTAFMKEFRKKSLTDPKVEKEFKQIIKNFHTKYDFQSFNRKREGQSTVESLNNFSETLNQVIGGNSQNFGQFFNIAGLTAGAIIKGASILLISGINLLNHVIDQTKPDQLVKGKGGQGLIESFFDWDPGTLVDLGNEMLDALTGLFSRTGKLAFFGTWITEQFGILLYEVSGFFWSALKEAGKAILPKLFDQPDTLAEVMTKVERGAPGAYKSKGSRSGANINLETAKGKLSYASSIKDLDQISSDSGGSLGMQRTVTELRGRALKNTAQASDYALASMIEGNVIQNQGAGGMGPTQVKKMSSSLEIGKEEERKFKEKHFELAFREAFNTIKSESDPYNLNKALEAANKLHQIGDLPGGYKDDLEVLKEFASKDFIIREFAKTPSYYRLMGKYIDNISGQGWLYNSGLKNDFIEDIIGNPFSIPSDRKSLKALRNDFADNRPEILLDQLNAFKHIEKDENKRSQQRSKASAIISAGAMSQTGDGIFDIMTSFTSSFAAKPGGFVDRMFSGLSNLSGEAAKTSANVNTMYGDNSIENTNNKLTNKKVDNICKKLEEYKETAKNAKLIDVPFDISDEICDMLGTRLVQRGILDKMSRPDIMSASALRLSPESSVSGNLQPGRQGINPGQEYLYYDV